MHWLYSSRKSVFEKEKSKFFRTFVPRSHLGTQDFFRTQIFHCLRAHHSGSAPRFVPEKRIYVYYCVRAYFRINKKKQGSSRRKRLAYCLLLPCRKHRLKRSSLWSRGVLYSLIPGAEVIAAKFFAKHKASCVEQSSLVSQFSGICCTWMDKTKQWIKQYHETEGMCLRIHHSVSNTRRFCWSFPVLQGHCCITCWSFLRKNRMGRSQTSANSVFLVSRAHSRLLEHICLQRHGGYCLPHVLVYLPRADWKQ